MASCVMTTYTVSLAFGLSDFDDGDTKVDWEKLVAATDLDAFIPSLFLVIRLVSFTIYDLFIRYWINWITV